MPNKKVKNNTENILVICAHSDDQIFGPGGTIAKYAKEGKNVHTVIVCYGEQSHPWFEKQHIIPSRVKEAKAVDKFIGGNGVIFLGYEEGKMIEEMKTKKAYERLKKLILEYKPHRIFTHSLDDPLTPHKATNKLVVETLDKMKYPCEVYMFDVWNIFNLKKRHYVKIVVDISDTFKIKIKALKMFKSQGGALFLLMWSVYLRTWWNGLRNKVKYAEVFYKIR